MSLFFFFYLLQQFFRYSIQQIILMSASWSVCAFPDLILNTLYFLLQISGRIESASLTPDDNLLQTVRGCHHDLIFSSIFMGKLLDILIRRLCFLCKYHMNIVVINGLCPVSLYPVCIKYCNHFDSTASLIITENIQKLISGTVDIYLRQFF